MTVINIGLSSYKVVQFLKDWSGPDPTKQSPIKIKARTTRRWLNQLGFTFQDVRKDDFIDGDERADVVENRVEFFQFMADLEPYLVEFDSEGKIKERDYPPDCEVGGINRRPVICITHDVYFL